MRWTSASGRCWSMAASFMRGLIRSRSTSRARQGFRTRMASWSRSGSFATGARNTSSCASIEQTRRRTSCAVSSPTRSCLPTTQSSKAGCSSGPSCSHRARTSPCIGTTSARFARPCSASTRNTARTGGSRSGSSLARACAKRWLRCATSTSSSSTPSTTA